MIDKEKLLNFSHSLSLFLPLSLSLPPFFLPYISFPLQPVGHAVAMVLVPAMHSGDSRVFLWGRSNVAAPLHIFTGHSEAVLEVQWRRHTGGESSAAYVQCTNTMKM